MHIHKIVLIFILAEMSLFACNQYPGHKHIGVKMSLKPIWGDLIEQDIIPGGDCHLDSINDESGEAPNHRVRQSASVLKAIGWAAVSGKDGITASDIAITLSPNPTQGYSLFAATTKGKRPDVAEYFNNQGAVDTGFSVTVDISEIPLGSYVLEVIQHKGEKNFKCQYTSNIIVEE